MDLNQWGWAESILRISTQIASREPLVTQYEGMLHGLLTDQICALGLTVHREKQNQRENYFIRHKGAGIAMQRISGDDAVWWAENYTPHVDLQVGRHDVGGHPDVFLKIELKTAAIFPYKPLNNLMSNGANGWWNDLVHLTAPEDNPRADALLFVVDQAVYRAMIGYQVRRSPPGRGQPPTVSEFGPFCPTYEDVEEAAGGQVNSDGIHARTDVVLSSICRLVRCRAQYPSYWYKLPQDEHWIGGENGVQNDTMVVGIVGLPAE